MYTKNSWMDVPHSIWKALSSIAFIFHSASLSESQLCFSGCVSLSTWHCWQLKATCFRNTIWNTWMREIPFKHKRKSSSREDVQTWEQVTQRNCGIIISGNIQSPAGWAVNNWLRLTQTKSMVGLDQVWKPLPAPTVLSIYESIQIIIY